ncbi:MAG: preprotein translocase subunit SecG [bacterium]|nr:preprotein translocase subunit SecG [bacterium]
METLRTMLPYAQIIISVLIIVLVLLQQTEGSLGSAFGGGSGSQTHFEKRGSDKLIFQTTIVLGILFVVSTLLTLILQ